jgi:hypothetical protein
MGPKRMGRCVADAQQGAVSMKKAKFAGQLLLPRFARSRMPGNPPDRLRLAVVPPVRVERTLLAELDFESSASTNSATGAQ